MYIPKKALEKSPVSLTSLELLFVSALEKQVNTTAREFRKNCEKNSKAVT
jgi:hypothetical protein